ncbi:tripartite motif-containing protein 55-like [Saccostrea cucullata]|uniref:tripartite motif-containing protein 55-like n=1 Tax=Saccostrea cuccullata TaxID=36930 RepID=UPI002ED54EF1
MMQCDLCETVKVEVRCDSCLVNLCKACVGAHMISDECTDHKLIKYQSRKPNRLYPECKYHNKQHCTMYCNKCKIPVCKMCLASGQHLSHKLSEILKAVNEKKDKLFKERHELNEIIYPTYQHIASDVQNRMNHLEKIYGDLSAAITEHGRAWHTEIEKRSLKLQAKVEKMKKTQLQTLQKHLDEINKNISDIRNDIKSIERTIDADDMSKLLRVTSNVHLYSNLPQKIAPSLPKFIPGEVQGEEFDKLFGILLPSSLTLDENGYSLKPKRRSSEAESPSQVKQLLDEPEIVTNIDTGFEYLINVACLSDNEIWTRGNDSTMKLYSINQGSIIKSIKTKSGNIPWDIAVTKSGDLVYTDISDRTVNIVKNKKIENVIKLQNWTPRGVCSTSSGDLLVTMCSHDDKHSKIIRYSGSTEKQTIQYDDHRKPLFSIYTCITENRNLDICVSDNGIRAIVVVNHAGRLRFRYTGHSLPPKNRPFIPLGITTDSQSHILTTDDNNHCVHIIDKNGHFLQYIDCELSEPVGLCTDLNYNLYVAQWRKRQVKKIKYLVRSIKYR